MLAQGRGRSGSTNAKEMAPVTRTYALTGVEIMQAPGKSLGYGTILIKNGLIQDLGPNVSIPGEAEVIKADSMIVYAGFIDGFSHTGIPKPKNDNSQRQGPRPSGGSAANPTNERAGIQPHLDAGTMLDPKEKSIASLRGAGFTMAHVVPRGRMLPGQGAVILLAGDSKEAMVFRSGTALFSQLAGGPGVYPATVIGVMSKYRELYEQAKLAQKHEAAYTTNPAGMSRPNYDPAVRSFYPVIDGKMPVLFMAKAPLDGHRALMLQKDLGFTMHLVGVERAWELTDKLKASNTGLFLSMDMPKEEKPSKKKADKKGDKKAEGEKPAKEDDKPSWLEKEQKMQEKRKAASYKMHTEQAGKLAAAGVNFAFSSEGTKASDVHKNVRTMVANGLSEDAALAALTTQPAKMLGLSQVAGTVEKGKIANLVVTDKSYFAEDAQIRYVFVDGHKFEFEAKSKKKAKAKSGEGEATASASGMKRILGTWSYTAETPGGSGDGTLEFVDDGSGVSGTITNSQAEEAMDVDDVTLNGNDLSFSFSVDAGGQMLTIEVEVTLDGDSFEGTMNVGQFGSFPLSGSKESGPDR